MCQKLKNWSHIINCQIKKILTSGHQYTHVCNSLRYRPRSIINITQGRVTRPWPLRLWYDREHIFWCNQDTTYAPTPPYTLLTSGGTDSTTKQTENTPKEEVMVESDVMYPVPNHPTDLRITSIMTITNGKLLLYCHWGCRSPNWLVVTQHFGVPTPIPIGGSAVN